MNVWTSLHCPHTFRVTAFVPAVTLGYGHWEGGWKCLACGHLESVRWIAHEVDPAKEPMNLVCQSCGASRPVTDEEGARLLELGDAVRTTTPQQGWSTVSTFEICKACQAKERDKQRLGPRRKRNVDIEHRELMHLIAQTRQAHPDWSLKKCVHESVEYMNRPDAEPDAAFRAYLLDREDR